MTEPTQPQPTTPQQKLRALAPHALFVVSLAWLFGPSLFAHMQRSSLVYVMNDDARQQIYPFFRYFDAQLFTRDYVGDYYLACLPWGYRALYMLAGHFDLATQVSKVLPYLGLSITVFGVARSANAMAGKLAAWVAAALCLSCGVYLSRMSGGLPRGFAFPLLASAGLALTLGRMRWLACLVPLSAAFYPAAAVPTGLALALVLFVLPAKSRGEACDWDFKRRAIFTLVTAFAAALVLLPSALSSRGFGQVITPSMVHEFPEAGPGGRYGPTDRAPFASFASSARGVFAVALTGAGEPLSQPLHTWAGSPAHAGALLMFVAWLAGVGFVALCFQKPEALRFLTIGVAAGVSHAIAVPIAPFFYLPQRYVMYPVPILTTVIVATGIAGYVGLFAKLRERRGAVPIAVALFGLPLLAAFGGHGSANGGLHTNDRATRQQLAQVARLPKDALIAGWPRGLLDDIPYGARRQAFLNFETHQAFHTGYALEMRRRMRALVAAYFGTSIEPMLALRKDFGVTHLWIDPRHFRRPPPYYFAPFWKPVAVAFKQGEGNFEAVRQLAQRTDRSRGPLLLDLAKLRPSLPESH